MKKILPFLFVLVLFPLCVLAADSPFAGKWKLNDTYYGDTLAIQQKGSNFYGTFVFQKASTETFSFEGKLSGGRLQGKLFLKSTRYGVAPTSYSGQFLLEDDNALSGSFEGWNGHAMVLHKIKAKRIINPAKTKYDAVMKIYEEKQASVINDKQKQIYKDAKGRLDQAFRLLETDQNESISNSNAASDLLKTIDQYKEESKDVQARNILKNANQMIAGFKEASLNRSQKDLYRKAKKIIGEAQTSFVNGEYDAAIEKGNQAVRILTTMKDLQ